MAKILEQRKAIKEIQPNIFDGSDQQKQREKAQRQEKLTKSYRPPYEDRKTWGKEGAQTVNSGGWKKEGVRAKQDK